MESETADRAWPEPLARRTAALLAVLADPARPNHSAVHDAVLGLTSVPGITEARLDALDAPGGERFGTGIPVGPAHVLRLAGPEATRPDVVQAAGLVAESLAVRLRDPAGDDPRLAEKVAFYQAIGRYAPFFVAMHDERDVPRWMSRSPHLDQLARDTEGLEDLLNRIDPADLDRLTELRAGLAGAFGDSVETDIRFTSLAGELRTAHVVIRNLLADPAVRGLVSYATDVTALRATEYNQRIGSARLRTLIDAIGVAILVVDENMRLAEVNPKAMELMRVDAPVEAVIGCSVAELVEMADRGLASREILKIASDFADRSISGGVPVHAEELHFPDGVVIEADYLPIDLDGEVRGHFLVGRVVTDRVAAQQALETRNRELANLAMLKNEFLATLSHELRTPLTAASSLLELLGEDDTAPPGDMVDALRRNNSRLLSIVEDLLLLARFESEQVPLEMQRMPSDTVLGDKLTALRAEAAQHGVSIVEAAGDQRDSAELMADPRWLQQMIRYVVSGAFASRPGTRITLRENLGPDGWTLTVSGDTLRTAADSGRGGLAGAGRDRIGIGLGLTLARSIAHRHGGDLRIESDSDGAVVRITLPIR